MIRNMRVRYSHAHVRKHLCGVEFWRVYLVRYLNRAMRSGFDFKADGGLNQLLSSFAFAMVGVGLAAPVLAN